MAKSSTRTSAKEGTKTVDTSWGGKLTVPASTVVGKKFNTKSSLVIVGEDCVFGDYVSLDAHEVGDSVRIDYGSSVDEYCTIGNNVTIGSNTMVGKRCQIERSVVIGNDVHVGQSVTVQPGVIIPDNWIIPNGAIVNPGKDGFPVVIVPVPDFSCNVSGRISVGDGL